MPEPTIAPYGSWKSPITTDLITGETVRLGSPMFDGSAVYWTESRPAESGRVVVVRQRPGAQPEELTPAPINVRSRAHEYGGGAYTVHGGVLYYVDFASQHLYRRDPDGAVRQLSQTDGMRYADMVVDAARGRIIAVREDHTVEGREALNTIVSLSLEGGDERVLAAGNDFYANPRLSPDGGRLCWITWNHPNMPWDGTELWVADVRSDGSLADRRRVAGGPEESIFQPEWSPAGVLHFVSDRTGWWNLYRLRGEQTEPLHPMEAEFGLPQWVFGIATYGFVGDEQILCTYTQRGIWHLALLDTSNGAWERIDADFTEFEELHAAPGRAVCIGGSPGSTEAVAVLDVATRRFSILKRAGEVAIDPGYLSIAEPIEFPTEGGLTAHAFYYPPRNRDYRAPEGELPPLLVRSHGGPTGASSSALCLDYQYWTSRGFAVLDVNYGGSTGYGRAYRQRLNGRWGVVDVDDCVNAARYLVQRRLADGDRLAITGGSAGGYTTLCALTFRDTFTAGASHYGVSDAELLAKETHKFESRYLDSIIGPYPQERELYRQRSPIHFTDRLSCPLILFQGLDDKVVPPNQAELMYEAVRAKGLPVALIEYPGEGHGFRKAENIKRTLEAQLYFLGKVFGFVPADELEPVAIENL